MHVTVQGESLSLPPPTHSGYPHLTLDALESAIAAELEGFYLRQHGEEKGRQIACALLEDLMEAGPLKAAQSLSFLGLAVMDELCARHITSPVLH
ncbi:DUF5375 family protein [Klebsiella oxytoca]|uniref:DUF5375 family protein n=1 Tax=Klebsiella oxytoca TaxID=571 RepID=UPI00157AB720|nr:DUF5375 family protein [Klebsiella oxytoca]